MTKLTEKQQAFVANKVAGVANRDAAIAAGYSVTGAAVAADKLMKHPGVLSAIKAAAPNVSAKANTLPKMPREKYTDPKVFLSDVMNLTTLPIAVRADAAKQLLPYQHAKMGEVGKKQSKVDRAKVITAGRGKFAPKAPPALTVVRNE
ncbi:terminase small subunit [Luteimonas changyuni]|uniref:terminase small subunit n=1 Tax=Luteimonas sp. MJ145 TaxID=3129234 RepID=UPI0031BA033F